MADILQEGFETAAEGSTFVVTRYRETTQNLRTTFQKIVKRAGLPPWPKLFQNIRSTRETELAEQYPLQAVTAWMGNSQLVAATHYLQLTDAPFEKATSEATHPTTKLGSVAHQTCEMAGTGEPLKSRNPGNVNVLRMASRAFSPCEWAMRDSNPRLPRCKRGALTN